MEVTTKERVIILLEALKAERILVLLEKLKEIDSDKIIKYLNDDMTICLQCFYRASIKDNQFKSWLESIILKRN